MDIKKLTQDIAGGGKITLNKAKQLASVELYGLLYYSNELRKHFKKNKINLCCVINAKSGACSENCRFCAQSVHYKAKANIYPLVGAKEIKKGLQKAVSAQAHCFGIVTSGHRMAGKEIDKICKSAALFGNNKINFSASLGAISRDAMLKLKKAGIGKFHHNLETSESYFPSVCTTHKYKERMDTIKAAKQAGLKVCSGGIFGLGETMEQRIELAFTLRELDVESIPLNFLNPIKGTPLERAKSLSPLEILRIIALFRFILPDKDISVCGGREINLRDLQSWIFYAGANGMMVGGYLTTPGRSVEEDIKMIGDLGLEING